jgi:hypothetical protein
MVALYFNNATAFMSNKTRPLIDDQLQVGARTPVFCTLASRRGFPTQLDHEIVFEKAGNVLYVHSFRDALCNAADCRKLVL